MPGDLQRMNCMEIWGGNRRFEMSFEATGLNIFVQSNPFHGNDQGGDIYYLTSCASGRITRFLLADVSGHGPAASGLAGDLKELLRQNVNKISQESFVSQMNHQFIETSGDRGFATAIVATFFLPTHMLDICVAGHPPPIYFNSEEEKWSLLNAPQAPTQFKNLPLGVVDAAVYPRQNVRTSPGDMFLLYTDAYIETACGTDQNAEMLGAGGLLRILNEGENLTSEDVIPYLHQRVVGLNGDRAPDDDASLILGQFTNTKVKLKDNLMAPIRLLGDVEDRTELIV